MNLAILHIKDSQKQICLAAPAESNVTRRGRAMGKCADDTATGLDERWNLGCLEDPRRDMKR